MQSPGAERSLEVVCADLHCVLSIAFRLPNLKLLFMRGAFRNKLAKTPDAKAFETILVYCCGCSAVPVGQLPAVYRLGDAATPREVRASHVAYAHAGVLPLPFRDHVDEGSGRDGTAGGDGSRFPPPDHRSLVRGATVGIAGQACGAGFRQLHLTALPAGGSCPQQAV